MCRKLLCSDVSQRVLNLCIHLIITTDNILFPLIQVFKIQYQKWQQAGAALTSLNYIIKIFRTSFICPSQWIESFPISLSFPISTLGIHYRSSLISKHLWRCWKFSGPYICRFGMSSVQSISTVSNQQRFSITSIFHLLVNLLSYDIGLVMLGQSYYCYKCETVER